MQKLLKKIEELTTKKQAIRDRIAHLNAEKMEAVDAVNAAMATGDVDGAVECNKFINELEANIKAREGILAALERERPFDAKTFFAEFDGFQEAQKGALSEKYEKLTNGIAELNGLYRDYENAFAWYSSQLATWQDMGNKISLGQLPKFADETAGVFHRKIKNGLSGLTKEINQ